MVRGLQNLFGPGPVLDPPIFSSIRPTGFDPWVPTWDTFYKRSLCFQPFKAINKKGGKRVKSAKSKKVDVLTKESKRVFDEPKEEEITEEVPETKKDLFEDGDDDEGKLIIS